MSWTYTGIEDRRFLNTFKGTDMNPTGVTDDVHISGRNLERTHTDT